MQGRPKKRTMLCNFRKNILQRTLNEKQNCSEKKNSSIDAKKKEQSKKTSQKEN